MISRSDRSRTRGFTLIEMLIVLVILGMVMTVMPTLLSSLPGARLRAAADGMADTLKQLRAQAIGSGLSTGLRLEPRARGYATLPDGRQYTLPDAVVADDVTTTVSLLPGGAGIFRFFPDGTATGGTIRLRNGDRVATIEVDWLTGRVRRPD